MAKAGRPGIPYERFLEVWEKLLTEGRAKTNIAHDILGGSNSTIAAYREKYEREKSAKALNLINSIELTDAVHAAIAGIKVKEIEALQKLNTQLKARIDEYIAMLTETEAKLAQASLTREDENFQYEAEKLKLERELAAAQARAGDTEKREAALGARVDQLTELYAQAKQEAAVARKEADMLREAASKK